MHLSKSTDDNATRSFLSSTISPIKICGVKIEKDESYAVVEISGG